MSVSQNDIKNKIKQLREYWFDDNMSLKWVEGVEKRLRELAFKEKLGESKAIVDIVDDIKKRINAANIILQSDEELTDINRKLLFREKKVYQFFLDRLDSKDLNQQFEKVGELLDVELKSVGLLVEKE